MINRGFFQRKKSDDVYHHHGTGIDLFHFREETGIGDKGNLPLRESKVEAVGFDRVDVGSSRRESHISKLIDLVGLKNLDSLQIVEDIIKNDAPFSEDIMGGKKDPLFPESSLGHGFNHDIHISRVVQVLMRQEDAIEFCWIQPGTTRETSDKSPRTRVQMDIGLPG
jgi:hypothetical protein